MSTPRSATERTNRKSISEALLKEMLGLNELWVEHWEENGASREASCAPDHLPEFIRRKLNSTELKDVEERVDQLVAVGCQRSVVYFCLEQLSPASEWIRSGGRYKGVQVRAGEEYASQRQKQPMATREDMVSLSSSARAARRQIHRRRLELSLMAEVSKIKLPLGVISSAESPEDAFLFLDATLSWVARLADAYAAPMQTTLMKSKGQLYLTMYVSMYADQRKLRSPRVHLKDSKKASDSSRARRNVLAPGNPVAELINMVTGGVWSTSELKSKLQSFREDQPRLCSLLKQKLTELHTFAGR